MEFSLFLLCLSLGMRHGVDADHIAVIDSLSRARPWNGVLFALGHGLTVTILAVGAGALALPFPPQWSAWLLIGLGSVNLWRLLRPAPAAVPLRVPAVGPLLLGVLFAAGFETASQLSALMLVREVSPWLLGLAFSLGMVLVDGADGFLAARVWSRGGRGAGARVLGWIVVAFSFGLGGAELLGWELDSVALPLGAGLFALLVAVRLWGLRWSVQT
ncbi:MAG: nickel permease [Gemmatimonadaceae bacterium]|nr:nickel permease [Gloeobacterales cyanobacterium ES-bin-141]